MKTLRSEDWVDTSSAANRIGCAVQHLRLLVRQGKIEGSKFGRDWFVSSRSLEEYRQLKYEIPRPQKPEEVHEPARDQLDLFPPDGSSIVNVASVPQRSPFRYPGGKTWLIPIARSWLNSLPQKPSLLIEPFAGGGGIGLMAAFEGLAERSLLVELDPDVASVWKAMLNGESQNLQQRVRQFQCDYDNVVAALGADPKGLLDRAFQTLLRNRVSRGGILAPGAGLVKTGEANRGIASRWYPETLARRIGAIHELRSKIEFVEGDGLETIKARALDKSSALFIDPPYPVAGRRLYRFHELNHRELFKALSRTEAPILVTYDENTEIKELAEEFGLEWKLIPMKSTHHARKMELLISRDFSWLCSSPAQGRATASADPVSA